MTSLPTVSHATDDRSLRERVARLIQDFNSGRVADLAQALLDIADHETRLDALEDLADNDATTFLGANVALNNTANFFNGPNTGSIGASGQKWRISCVINARDTAGAAAIVGQIHDGTSAIVGNTASVAIANASVVIALERIVTLTGATTFTVQVRDPTSTSGVMLTTGAGTGSPANLATSITAVRLA